MGVLCTEYPFPQNPNGFYRGPMGRARSRLKNRHKKRSTCEKSQVLNLIYTLLLSLKRDLFEMCLFLFCAYYELASNKVLRSRFLLQHPLFDWLLFYWLCILKRFNCFIALSFNLLCCVVVVKIVNCSVIVYISTEYNS